MQANQVLLLQSDPHVAQMLSASLNSSFHAVHAVRSLDELRHAVAKHRPHSIILDLESVSLSQLEELKRDFQGVRIVCNHRVADEEMWATSLNAGADDVFSSSDMRAILFAASESASRQHAAAA